jgi:hypothetical protein
MQWLMAGRRYAQRKLDSLIMTKVKLVHSTMKKISLVLMAALLGLSACNQTTKLPPSHYDKLADQPYIESYPLKADIAALKQELLFERAVQAYLWALPALNMYGMKEGSEKVFGKGYNVLPIFKERMNAKTLITTPNFDVIYALGYLDLKEDGPMVIEVPPGLQGILDDFWQRPIRSEGRIGGREWAGDVGLHGPDQGGGGKYLILPPDYKGPIPSDYFTYRSSTYGVFVSLRDFFKDPKQLFEPVKVIEQTRIYPLGQEATARQMVFPDASATPANMLYPQDGNAFEMLSRFINHEYLDPNDMEMRGVLAGIDIIQGRPFAPDGPTLEVLDKAARTASRMGHVLAYQPSAMVPKGLYYANRHWINPFPTNGTFTADTYNIIDARTSFFTYAYSTSPGMAANVENIGAKYPAAYMDADGNFLRGSQAYVLHLPSNIPAAIFWSITVYDPITGSGLDNGQPFPSLNTMDKPIQNADGSTDIYFGPKSPGTGKNWIATVPGKGWFTLFHLYGPTKAFFDQSWKPDDIKNLN